MKRIRFGISASIILACAATLSAPAQAQALAQPDSGTADAGTGSRPIANVVANDTINGAAAVLGAGGNATITKVGSWPAGVSLNTTSGAVTTGVNVGANTYTGQYKLCDASNSTNCSTTNVTVNVIVPSIVANPDSGTADAGIGSQPIANVALNDTINGAPATLGPTGNATLLKGSPANPTWPPGLGFTAASGQVSTSASLAAGTYNVDYQLCDHNSPMVCKVGNVTVNVVTSTPSPVSDSGTGDAGVASRPIQNVTANDTMSGAPVVLGSSGNATISQSTTSPWPAGITLTTGTGAVNTAATVPAGQYPIVYNLCDRNAPPQCVSATDTITLIIPNINPTSDTGTAVAGLAQRPIASVVSNDNINGVPVTLGAGGNATINTNGLPAWPSGIVLNTQTGAVSTTATQMPGTYNMQYNLCDLNLTPVCSSTSVSVVISPAIVAAWDGGFTLVGNGATVIANVAANDSVNNAPAVLGPSGNATVTPFGNWQMGITLDPNSGAVAVSGFVPAGTYPLQYQLCDLNAIPDCALGNITVAVSINYTENQASATPMGDVEFDWGRDGIYCPSCNFGDGNARANWTDRQGNIWIAHLDENSGQFLAPGANDEQVDPGNANAFFWNTYGNGPEWAFSTQNGQIVSQLVYSRYSPQDPNPPTAQAPGYTGSGYAIQTGFNTWTTGFLPGTFSKTTSSNLPEGSQCNSDPVASVMFKNFGSPFQLFTEPLSTASGTVPLPAPISSANGIGERFVPCTHQVLFQGNVTVGSQSLQQVFWYNYDTGVVAQLTSDPTTKSGGFMFKAPDFGDNYILVTLAGRTAIQVYQQTGTNADGSPSFTLVNSIQSPDQSEPYMNSSEPFIHCTPTCMTYAFTTLSAQPDSQNGITVPNGLAVAALNPATPMFNVLAQAKAFPYRQRLDPEYFITPNGAYLYYNNITPLTGVSSYKNNGEWFIDMQLGVPSGPCVGSSAQGGLMPGC